MRKMLSKKAAVATLAGAAVLAMGTTTAVAADLIGSKDIKDESIKSRDIRDGQVKPSDLSAKVTDQLTDLAAANEALHEEVAALEARVADLENSATTAEWGTGEGVEIIDANTAAVTLAQGDNDGISIETDDLNVPVQANDVISFDYALSDGAQCTAGAPRMFVEVAGGFTNSWDQNQPAGLQCGEDGTVTFTVPSNGRIGAAGFVYDNGVPGTVTFSNVTVDGQAVTFQ